MINIGINTNLLIYKTTAMNISFNLKGAKTIKKLYIRMHYGKLDLLVSTNLMLMESQWNVSTQTVNDDNDVNIGLSELKLAILKKFNQDYLLGIVINKKWLENVIKTSFMRPKAEVSLVNPAHTLFVSDFSRNWLQNHSDSWKVAAKKTMGKTLKGQYLKFVETLEEYEKLIGEKWQLRSLSVNDINGFVEWMETEEYQVSTIERAVGRLRFFLNRSVEQNIETSQAFKQRIYFGEEDAEIEGIYLNEKEIETVFNWDFSYDEKLESARDNLIISCWTALRSSDFLKNLDVSNIKDGIISIRTQKTKTFVKIAVHPQVKSILNKRFGNLPQKLKQDEYNILLKKIGEICGFNQVVFGKLFDKEKKRKVTGYYRKFQLLSSHVGRKSFATNLSGKVDDEIIMATAGWSTKSMKNHYDKTSKTEYAEKLQKHFNNN